MAFALWMVMIIKIIQKCGSGSLQGERKGKTSVFLYHSILESEFNAGRSYVQQAPEIRMQERYRNQTLSEYVFGTAKGGRHTECHYPGAGDNRPPVWREPGLYFEDSEDGRLCSNTFECNDGVTA